MRTKMTPTVDRAVADEARALGFNMSRVAEQAIAAAAKAERNRRWAEENRAALDAHARQIATEGCALMKHRRF